MLTTFVEHPLRVHAAPFCHASASHLRTTLLLRYRETLRTRNPFWISSAALVQAVFLWYPPLHPVNVTARFTPILKQNRYHFASRINSKQIWLQRDSRLEMRGQQLVFVVRACKICSWLLPESAAESVLMCDCARQCQRTNVKKLWIQGVAHLFSERCG